MFILDVKKLYKYQCFTHIRPVAVVALLYQELSRYNGLVLHFKQRQWCQWRKTTGRSWSFSFRFYTICSNNVEKSSRRQQQQLQLFAIGTIFDIIIIINSPPSCYFYAIACIIINSQPSCSFYAIACSVSCCCCFLLSTTVKESAKKKKQKKPTATISVLPTAAYPDFASTCHFPA